MTLVDIPTRPQIDRPDSLHSHEFVRIFYPPVREIPMLIFPCFASPTNVAVSGVHLGMVLSACKILANNESGYLSHNLNGQSPIPSNNLDSFLRKGSYYYFVNSDPSHQYPLCISIDSWIPPKELPGTWRDVQLNADDDPTQVGIYDIPHPGTSNPSSISRKVKQLDEKCVLSGVTSCLNPSHMIHQSLEYWFEESNIDVLADDELAAPNSFQSLRNIIVLRADIHGHLFDKNHFVFTPIGGRLVVHFIRPGAGQYAYTYHLRTIDIPSRIRRHYLYVRFAYSVLSLVQDRFVVRLPEGVAVPERYTKPANVPNETNDTQSSFSDGACGPTVLPDDVRPLREEIISHKQRLEDKLISRIGDTLDSDNVHLLSQFELEGGIYPGCTEMERITQSWIRNHPQIRQTVEPTTTVAKIGDPEWPEDIEELEYNFLVCYPPFPLLPSLTKVCVPPQHPPLKL
ncbi:hypothetical protein DL96DRAFT_1812908 [Flagelloscypha sp. PMI_526]|nr:hypothetical protein DL96DRAFT_1812908 [Flagelloscypha sp. PMI_526]